MRYTLYLSLPPRNILSQPISSKFLPLDLLPRDGQLSPETLERALRHLDKRPVQILLIVALSLGNAGDDGLGGEGGDGETNRLVRVESHVPVLVVVDVHVDLAGHGGRFGDGELVDCAESAIPGGQRSLQSTSRLTRSYSGSIGSRRGQEPRRSRLRLDIRRTRSWGSVHWHERPWT